MPADLSTLASEAAELHADALEAQRVADLCERPDPWLGAAQRSSGQAS